MVSSTATGALLPVSVVLQLIAAALPAIAKIAMPSAARSRERVGTMAASCCPAGCTAAGRGSQRLWEVHDNRGEKRAGRREIRNHLTRTNSSSSHTTTSGLSPLLHLNASGSPVPGVNSTRAVSGLVNASISEDSLPMDA